MFREAKEEGEEARQRRMLERKLGDRKTKRRMREEYRRKVRRNTW